MLLTVSDIKEPINFSDFSDLLAIFLIIDICVELANIKIGVKPRVMSPIFQQ